MMARESKRTLEGVILSKLVQLLLSLSPAPRKEELLVPGGTQEGEGKAEEEHALQCLIRARYEERGLGNPKGAEAGGQHSAQL